MENNYPDLDIIIEKNKYQKKIYHPTPFWEKASKSIKEDIEKHGINNFRRLETPLSFFVPSYGIPTNSFNEDVKNGLYTYLKENGTKKQMLAMEDFIDGSFHALSDYRVFISSDDINKKPELNGFSESNYGNPVEHFDFDGKNYSRSSLNYILGLCFLKKYLPGNDEIKTVLEIGGGFGTLGEILNFSEDIKYINIDIPPISFVSWNYLKQIYKNEIEPYVHDRESIRIVDLKACSVFNSWDIEKFEGSVDLFVNYISFQEMEPDIVVNYLNHIKRLDAKWILLRNMREGKQKRKIPTDVGVKIPIKKADYLSMIEDKYTLVATNVTQYGYKTVDGFHSELLLFKRIDG